MNLLITGGAGFIGSNLVEYFLKDKRVSLVRVLDNLSTGSIENIQGFLDNPKFEFINGDICDYDTCFEACLGIDKISHQAALGSVPRSIENPMKSTEVNILGTVNILYAAHVQSVERVILACSSSTYGDHASLPKVESEIGNLLSPYAVTKLCIEQFAAVFAKTYGLKWIGLRYFNVFGPKQTADNPYAAVIPRFIDAILNDKIVSVYGDGKQSRDFTFISNVIQANELSLFSESEDALNNVYNIGYGEQTELLQIIKYIEEIVNKKARIEYADSRPGDVRHSLASIEKASFFLNYKPNLSLKDGLKRLVEYEINKQD